MFCDIQDVKIIRCDEPFFFVSKLKKKTNKKKTRVKKFFLCVIQVLLNDKVATLRYRKKESCPETSYRCDDEGFGTFFLMTVSSFSCGVITFYGNMNSSGFFRIIGFLSAYFS